MEKILCHGCGWELVPASKEHKQSNAYKIGDKIVCGDCFGDYLEDLKKEHYIILEHE